MVMRKGLPAKLAATDADDTRYVLSGLVVCDTAGMPRGGVLSPVGSNIVTATGSMNVAVGRFQAAAVRDGGVVLLSNDGTVNVLLDAAPGANSRIDVIFAKQNDASSTVSSPDGNNLPVVGVVKGTAAASPVKPALPVGAVEIGSVQVPAGAVATNSPGVVISQASRFTAAAGGVVLFRTRAEMDATALQVGTLAQAADEGRTYERVGSSWVLRLGSVPGSIGADGNASVLERKLIRDADGVVSGQFGMQRTNGTNYETHQILGVLPVGFRPPYNLIVGNVLTYGSGSANLILAEAATGILRLQAPSPAGHTIARGSFQFLT